MNYSKPHLTFEQQAEQLISRNLIADKDELIQRLSEVSYYRLSGYFYTFRDKNHEENFVDNTEFTVIWDRYLFDRQLRLVVLDAIERIEIAVRTKLVYNHSKEFGPFGYANRENLPILEVDKFHSFALSLLRDKNRSKEKFVTHFNTKYLEEDYLPIWMACELMTFGSMFTFYKGFNTPLKRTISNDFDVNAKIFNSWLKELNSIRNICAHHGRLWNRGIGKILLPFTDEWKDVKNKKMYTVLTLCNFMLNKTVPDNNWKHKLKDLFDKHPDIPKQQMGFPENWEESSLWK